MTRPTAGAVLELLDLRRSFTQGARTITVLDGASAALRPGQVVALVGPSGAGKSTLLHIAGLLETVAAGRVIVNGRDCSAMDDDARTRIRRAEMGFVYQFHQLLPEFSAVENVMMPQLIQGRSKQAAQARASELLAALGLAARVDHRPAELSGGEQQRTAIARALANAPRLILADEPTGNLDPKTAELVFGELVTMIEQTGVAALIATHNMELVTMIEQTGVAALIATHNMELARRMHRVLRLEAGRLVEVSPSSVG